MALRRVAMVATRRLPASAVLGTRAMSEMSWRDRERAFEKAYFNKEEEKLLRRLLGKMKRQADTADKHGAVGASTVERSALNEIIEKYSMSDEDIAALIEWRHHEDF